MYLTDVQTIRDVPEKYHWYIIFFINKNHVGKRGRHVGTSPHLTEFLPPYCNVLYSNCFESVSRGQRSYQLVNNGQLNDGKLNQREDPHTFPENWPERVPRGLHDTLGVRLQFSSWGLEEFHRIKGNRRAVESSGEISLGSDSDKENCLVWLNSILPTKTTGGKSSVGHEEASEDEYSDEDEHSENDEHSDSKGGSNFSERMSELIQFVNSEQEKIDEHKILESYGADIDPSIESKSDVISYLRNFCTQTVTREHVCERNSSSESDDSSDDCSSVDDPYAQNSFVQRASEFNLCRCDNPDCLGQEHCYLLEEAEDSSSDSDSTTIRTLSEVSESFSADLQQTTNMECGPSYSGGATSDCLPSKMSRFIRTTGDNIRRKLPSIRNPFKRKRILDPDYIV
ncbi:uncharacterized protein LOC134820543 [Bolinopsis microptera]|uniref:uncharacterized protein LOC134820543 n=1 Tax=Bolinopsis microptera TaxID=2820187 RepID=UPI00307AD2BA